MSKSDLQKFAQKRNGAGGALVGVVKNLKETILPAGMKSEKKEIKKAIAILNKVSSTWVENYEDAKKEKDL